MLCASYTKVKVICKPFDADKAYIKTKAESSSKVQSKEDKATNECKVEDRGFKKVRGLE